MTDKNNIRFLLTKKTSWLILFTFFVFDNIVSYFAVKYLDAKEGNYLLAPVVEAYPLLYFLCIPLSVIIMYLLFKVIVKITVPLIKKLKLKNREILERIVLNAMVVYWAVGNSSGNVVFLLGYRIDSIMLITTLTAIPVTVIYVLTVLLKVRKQFTLIE